MALRPADCPRLTRQKPMRGGDPAAPSVRPLTLQKEFRCDGAKDTHVTDVNPVKDRVTAKGPVVTADQKRMWQEWARGLDSLGSGPKPALRLQQTAMPCRKLSVPAVEPAPERPDPPPGPEQH